MSQKYVLLRRSLEDKGILLTPEQLEKYHIDREKEHFTSLCYYNENHKKLFDKEKSVAGIKDTVTDKLAFDFDDKTNLENARQDTLALLKRFKEMKISKDSVDIYFSGDKGFHVILNLENELNPEQAKNLAINHFGKGLSTLDTSIYNPSRVFRLSGTKHKSSALYKTPLTFEEISTNDCQAIREFAKSNRENTVLRPKKRFLIPDIIIINSFNSNSEGDKRHKSSDSSSGND